MPPLVLPSDQRPAVVVHVGMGKTGTSTIQATFHRSRKLLRRQGILYPRSPGKRRHTRLGLAMQPDPERPRTSAGWRRQEASTPAELRPAFEEALFAELGQGEQHVVFSDEALLAATPEGIDNMRELFDRMASRVRVVAYLRRQDDHLCSRYQQVVKREGEVRTLAERATLDMSRVYDYRAQLEAWRDRMRPDELVVRTFEPAHFEGGSLVSDFVAATGLDVDAGSLADLTTKNESLDAESVEFLRLLNLVHRQRDEVPAIPVVGRMVRRLQRSSEGSTLTLPDAALDDFMEQWRESNETVAREFVAGAPPELFRTPRKTRNTTTEQYLDPARLDHFFTVTELSEELRDPLRRVAESEAERRTPGGNG